MNDSLRSAIRHIFLSPRPNFVLMTAAELLGVTLGELRRSIDDGAIVAVPTRLGLRVPKEELMAAALQRWAQADIEEALGAEGAAVLPEALRLVELRARVPRYQRDMLRVLAEWRGTTADEVLIRELEGVACGYADELRAAVPGFATAMAWPAAR
jgi:excisionase family DNA binding protein